MRVLILLWLFLTVRLHAATINAASGAYDDVRAAYESSVAGDTIQIPVGTNTWTTNLVVTKAISIIGAGGTNGTCLIDEQVSRSSAFFHLTTTDTTNLLRISNIEFRGGTNTGSRTLGFINVNSQSKLFRCDRVFFNRVYGRPFNFVDTSELVAAGGLIDQCRFDQNGNSGFFWNTSTLIKGHYAWSNAVPWGTTNMGYYVENNFFSNSVTRAITDGRAGRTFVFRNNICYNVAVENHETDNTWKRGFRGFESYGNTFIGTAGTGEAAHLIRTGTALIFSNDVSGGFPALLRMMNAPMTDFFTPIGYADGTNIWHENDPTLYVEGTHDGTNNAVFLTDSTKNWTPNEWRDYSLLNNVSNTVGLIYSNTATTLHCLTPLFGTAPKFSAGDRYEIRFVIRVLDGPGAGRDTIPITGGSGSSDPTPPGWPEQEDEPIYYWNNTGTGGISDSDYGAILPGRNYTNIALVGYTPLVYPHPLADSQPSPPAGTTIIATNFNAGTVIFGP